MLESGWNPIAEHELLIRGIDGSRLSLTAIAALSAEVVLPQAVSFRLKLHLPESPTASELALHTLSACYGNLARFRDGLAHLRATAEGEARLELEGLTLRLYWHRFGIRSGCIVEGEFSSFHPRKWRRRIGDAVLHRAPEHPYYLQFAFPTTLVDPPYIDQLIGQLDGLIADLDNDRGAP